MQPSLIRASTAARVAARLREELGNIERVVALIADGLDAYPAEPTPPVVTIHGLGGLVHDFYTGVEKLFREISPYLNGELPSGDAWHRELLHSMVLDLPCIRPPVIQSETEQELLEYLKFRHLYRNMYGFRLDWRRVRELAEGVVPIATRVRGELDVFLAYLDILVAGGRLL